MNRILLILTLLSSVIGNAQSVELHSLKEAQDIAIKQNATLRSSDLYNRAARYDQTIATSGMLPSVSINASSDYNLRLPVQLIPAQIFGGPVGTFQEVRFGRSWNSLATIDFTQPLIHADKLAQLKAGKYTREQVEFEQADQQKIIMRRVTAQYFNILVLQQALMLNQSLDSSATDLYEAAEAKFEQQVVSRVDLNRTENLMHQTRQQTLQIKTNLQIARQNLAVLLNLPPQTDLKVEDALNNYAHAEMPSIPAAEKRNAYLAAEKAEQAAYWRMRQNMYAMFPKLSLNSRYTFANQTDVLFDPSATNFNYGTIGVSLSVPLFRGRNLVSTASKSRLQYSLATIQKEQQLLTSGKELLEWQLQWNEKNESRKLAVRRDEITAQSLALSMDSFNEGVISLDQLFNIYNEYVQARNSYLLTNSDAATFETYLQLENQ